MLSMTETLRNRFLDAKSSVASADEYYLQLSSTIERDKLLQWENEIQRAEAMRGKDLSVMDIYAVRLPEEHPTQELPSRRIQRRWVNG